MTESASLVPAPGVRHIDALPAGTRLAEFEIQALLGVGGFGMVYQAFDHSLRRSVAIKEYMPSALAGRAQGQSLWVRTSSDEQTFRAGLASFVNEARLLAQFDHPSLVKVFRFWEANNTAYMVMPLYAGMTFKQARAQMRTPPPEAWLRKVLWAVLDALRVLHGSHMLHRDISPDNIFLQDAGPPVLLDLGAARHAINDNERQHTAVLKVNYAPIEQYAGGEGSGLPQGPWSDLYSLAAVVYGCLCNDTPLPATLRSIRDRMVRFPRVAKTVRRQFGVEYSEPFVDAITQALELQPQKRPQSIDAFLERMDMKTAPEGLRHFNWRAELGSIWMPAAEGGATSSMAGVDAAADAGTRTRNMEPLPAGAAVDVDIDTMVLDAPLSEQPAEPEEVAAAPRPSPAPLRHGARRPWAWGGAAAAMAGVVFAGWWAMRAPAAPPKDDIITEWAVPAAAPASAAVVPAALELPAAEAVEPAAREVPAPVSGAEAPAAPASRPVAARRTAHRTSASEPVAAVGAVAPERPVPAPEPASAPPPRPRPAAPAPDPLQACAQVGFLSRPLCLYQECQKPGLASHPVCVENRRHLEAEEQRRRTLGQ